VPSPAEQDSLFENRRLISPRTDDERESKREQELERARLAHEEETAKMLACVEAANREVDEFRTKFETGDAEAIVDYFSLVLDAIRFPEGFERKHRIAFIPESRQLVMEYELPPLSIVPPVRLYRFVRSRDVVEENARPQAQLRSLYAQVVAQTAVRAIHEVFEADRGDHLETIVLNGYVDTIDSATGKSAKPHLVTVRASKEASLLLCFRCPGTAGYGRFAPRERELRPQTRCPSGSGSTSDRARGVVRAE
jgi:restriction system protein